MIAKRMPADINHLNAFAMIALSEHVVDRIDFDSRSIVGLHYIMKEIEQGITICYAAFDEGKMIGVVFGELLPDDIFKTHIAFERNVDTLEAVKLIEEKLVADFNLKAIIAHIPEKNKAPQLLFRRLGAKKIGTAGEAFKSGPDTYEDCVILRKEYN